MPTFDGGDLEVWSPDLFPYDDGGKAGLCRFSPNCGGTVYKVGGVEKVTKPDTPSCPGAPAEFAERMGMDERSVPSGTGASAERRYMAICRARAIRRFGARDVRITEEQAAAKAAT